MPDGFVTLRKGEKRPVFGQEAVTSGTLSIASTPAPVATLYSASGVAVSGFTGVGATGFDMGALAAPRAWLNLDTAGLAVGFYQLVFTFTATASTDGTTRIYTPAIEVQVLDVMA